MVNISIEKVDQEVLDRRTMFRHGQRTVMDLREIIRWLEHQRPGSIIKTSDAIRFAIGQAADLIRNK